MKTKGKKNYFKKKLLHLIKTNKFINQRATLV